MYLARQRAILDAAMRWVGTRWPAEPNASAELVCGVALKAIGQAFVTSVGWLLENLRKVSCPEVGDLIGLVSDAGAVTLMIYVGNGTVLGTDRRTGKVGLGLLDESLGLSPELFRRMEACRTDVSSTRSER